MENRTTIQISEELRQELKVLAAKRDISYQKLLSDMISVFKELDRSKTILSIPRNLAEKVELKVKNTSFNSNSEYITFILRLVMSEDNNINEDFDETQIKERLKKLGYI